MDLSAVQKYNVKRWLVWGMIFLMGVLLRLFYLRSLGALPVLEHVAGPDVSEYYLDALRIRHGNWQIDPGSIHGALYGYILAFFLWVAQGDLWWTRFLQSSVFLGGILVPLRGILAQRCSTEVCEDKSFMRFLPEASMLLAALYPPLVIYQCDFYSENAMIILLLFALWCLSGKTYWHKAMAGLCCGGALTAHAGGIFFLPLGGLYLFTDGKETLPRKQRLFSCGAFLLGAFLVIAPLSIYKSVKNSEFVLLQKNSMFNAFLGNNPVSTGTCYLPPGVRWEETADQAEKEALQQSISKETVYRNRILQYLAHSPISFAALWVKKAAMTLSAREFTTWSDVTPLGLIRFHKWGFHGWFLVLLMLGGPFLVMAFFQEKRREFLKPFLLLFLTGYASNVCFLTSGRYRLILVIPLIVCTGAFICAWYEDLKGAWRGLPYFVILFLLFGISVYPYKISMFPERDYSRSLLADVLLRSGKPGQVLELYREKSAGSVFPERKLSLMGRAYMDLKDFRNAYQCYVKATEQFPRQAEHWMNLGVLYSEMGRLPQAAICMERAKTLKMTAVMKGDLEYNLGKVYQSCRRLDLAETHYRNVLLFNPVHRKALNNLGTICLMKRPSDIAQAIACFKRSLTLEPGNNGLKVNLAVSYAMQGNRVEALRVLDEILKADPQHKGALQMKKTLEKE